jgi:hypothetical protein
MRDGLLKTGRIVGIVSTVIALVGCSSLSTDKGRTEEMAQTISSVEYSQIKTAIRTLPPALERELDRPHRYRIVADSAASARNNSADIITLQKNSFSSQAADDAAFKREILTQFFVKSVDRLDLFCSESAVCRPADDKKKQMAHFFRGSYLQRQNDRSEKSEPELLRDAYAYHATEYFADAAYRCKRPLVAKVLESIWDYAPAPQQCNNQFPFLVTESSKPGVVKWVDPSRVYAVHLLFAGESGSTMSRFGHVSLRLIQCNKDRVVVDKECEKDLFDHISLGFKASIDEIDLSLWKGMTGGYALKLYANVFMDTYREYTIDEFRPVYSLPIVLEGEDKDFMVAALSEIHWTYRNDYRFFTRNCATEVLWLLNAIASARHGSTAKYFEEERYRPDRLFGDAKQAAQFKGTTLTDLATAEKSGNYFPSSKKYYQLAVDTVAARLPVTTAKIARAPEEWMEQDASFRREHWLKAIAGSEGNADSRAAHAAVVLESWVERNLRRRVLFSLGTYYGTILEAIAADKSMLDPAENLLLTSCLNAVKTNDTAGAYPEGIPQTEIAVDMSQACDMNNAALAAMMKKLFEKFPVSSTQRKAIDQLSATAQNIKDISATSQRKL